MLCTSVSVLIILEWRHQILKLLSCSHDSSLGCRLSTKNTHWIILSCVFIAWQTQYANLPSKLSSAMNKDKKPFTYTLGGVGWVSSCKMFLFQHLVLEQSSWKQLKILSFVKNLFDLEGHTKKVVSDKERERISFSKDKETELKILEVFRLKSVWKNWISNQFLNLYVTFFFKVKDTFSCNFNKTYTFCLITRFVNLSTDNSFQFVNTYATTETTESLTWIKSSLLVWKRDSKGTSEETVITIIINHSSQYLSHLWLLTQLSLRLTTWTLDAWTATLTQITLLTTTTLANQSISTLCHTVKEITAARLSNYHLLLQRQSFLWIHMPILRRQTTRISQHRIQWLLRIQDPFERLLRLSDQWWCLWSRETCFQVMFPRNWTPTTVSTKTWVT